MYEEFHKLSDIFELNEFPFKAPDKIGLDLIGFHSKPPNNQSVKICSSCRVPTVIRVKLSPC